MGSKAFYGLCALLCGMVALSGCSSGTTGSSATTGHAPITVGIICSCSGPFGKQVVDQVDLYYAFAKTVNKSGGIDGHPVKIIEENDASTPGTSVSEIQTLIADRVDAISDFSTVDSAWASSVGSSGIPIVGAQVAQKATYTYPDFYPEGQTEDSIVTATLLTAKAAGATNLAVLYCSTAAACPQSAASYKSAGAGLGVPVAYSATDSLTDDTAQCLAAKQANITAMLTLDASQGIATVATDCSNQGFNPIYVLQGQTVNADLVATSPGLKTYTVAAFPDIPYFANMKPVQAMRAAVNKYYPGILTETAIWDQQAEDGWTSGLLLEAAAKAGGLTPDKSPSAAEIVRGLTSLRGDTLGGMAPPLTFAKDQPHSIKCWFSGEIKNGVASVLRGGKYTCENS